MNGDKTPTIYFSSSFVYKRIMWPAVNKTAGPAGLISISVTSSGLPSLVSLLRCKSIPSTVCTTQRDIVHRTELCDNGVRQIGHAVNVKARIQVRKPKDPLASSGVFEIKNTRKRPKEMDSRFEDVSRRKYGVNKQ
jgi:cobalamin biosynthesis protein CbiG